MHLSKGQRGRGWLREQQPPCLQRDQCAKKSVIAADLRMSTIVLLLSLTFAECLVRHTFCSKGTCQNHRRQKSKTSHKTYQFEGCQREQPQTRSCSKPDGAQRLAAIHALRALKVSVCKKNNCVKKESVRGAVCAIERPFLHLDLVREAPDDIGLAHARDHIHRHSIMHETTCFRLWSCR